MWNEHLAKFIAALILAWCSFVSIQLFSISGDVRELKTKIELHMKGAVYASVIQGQ